MKRILDVIFVLDSSRSMAGKESKVIECFNEWLMRKKKEEPEIYVTAVLFQETCRILYLHMPVKYAKKLDGFEYYAYGNTAYYDSVNEVVEVVEELLKERSSSIDSKVVMFIFSDFFDNGSIWSTEEEMEILLEEKREEGWEIFLVENSDMERGIEKYIYREMRERYNIESR